LSGWDFDPKMAQGRTNGDISMWQSFWHIIWRSILYYPSIFSGNWFSIGVLPPLAFLFAEKKNLRRWRSMTAAEWKETRRNCYLLAGFYLVVFLWAVSATIYQDHSYLLTRLKFWRLKAESQSVYVETSIGPMYLTALPNPQTVWFMERMPVDVKFIWTRTGETVAEDVFPYGAVYLEPDFTDSTQRGVVEKFQEVFDQELKAHKTQHLEGPTLGFSDMSKWIWATSRQPGPPLTRKLEEELWDGAQILFMVSAVSYSTPSGQRYQGHFCNFLQPMNQNSLTPGRPMPVPMPNIAISFHQCSLYLSTVKE